MSELENYIWNMFSSTEQPGDRDKLMNCCIATFFLKDLSDVYENIEKESGFRVPEDARWSTLVRTTSDIGGALWTAFEALAEKNENMATLSESLCQDFAVLKDNKKLESIFLGLIPEMSLPHQITGNMFNWLLNNVIKNVKMGFGEYLPPANVNQLMAGLLDPQEGMSVCDPICKSAELLVQSEKKLQKQNPNARLKLYGQEENLNMWRIAKLNLILQGHPEAFVFLGDVIRDPQPLNEKKELCKFDRVICNPPFGKRDWGYSAASGDHYGRFRYGVPPKMTGEFAYIQHMMATLNNKGKMVVAVTSGALSLTSTEAIRKKIVHSTLIEAIIQLPSKAFRHTSIPICLIIVNMDKFPDRKDSVLFVNADNENQKSRVSNALIDEEIGKIVDAYKRYESIENFSHIVTLSDIVKNSYNLNVSLYFDKSPKTEHFDINKSMAEIKIIKERRDKLMPEMQLSLQRLGMIR
jgi:type I restriction enzyme M protein